LRWTGARWRREGVRRWRPRQAVVAWVQVASYLSLGVDGLIPAPALILPGAVATALAIMMTFDALIDEVAPSVDMPRAATSQVPVARLRRRS
jgi:hypothetical protein